MTVECGRAGRGAGSVLRALAGSLLAGLALIAGGCGNTTFTYGTPVMIVSTSAPGPFTGYLVGIVSITFTRTDGTIVQPVIPTGTGEEIVDFASLTSISELMGAPAALTGTYTSATVTLDYSAAQIFLNLNGKAVAATVVDDSGNAVTTVAYTVKFDPAHPLVLTQYKSTLLDVNFDLSASSVVGITSATTARVDVKPIMTISTVPQETKPIRSRGVFVTADPGAGTYIVNAQPFFDFTSQPFGAVDVQTSPQTTFNVNGVSYLGSAGLAALQQLNVNTLVSADGTLGSLDGVTPVFNATQVYAGSSLADQAEDRVRGIVSARTGNTITVQGVTVVDRLGVADYQPDITMTVGSGTAVSIDGEPTADVNSQSISVGQQIDAAGTLTPAAGTAGVYTSLDATSGSVRLGPTTLWGTLNPGATAGTASVDILTLGNFQPSGFNFAGTGSSASLNANPAAYIVNTGSADESATPAGTPLMLTGVVSPFGAAPPDFDASSVTTGANTDQVLVIDWVDSGATAPFLSIGPTGIVVTIDNAHVGLSHFVQTGPVNFDLKAHGINPRIVPDTTRTGQFAVGNPTAGLSEFNSFAGFVEGVDHLLNGVNAMQQLVAIGHYDSATDTFSAYRIDLAQQ